MAGRRGGSSFSGPGLARGAGVGRAGVDTWPELGGLRHEPNKEPGVAPRRTCRPGPARGGLPGRPLSHSLFCFPLPPLLLRIVCSEFYSLPAALLSALCSFVFPALFPLLFLLSCIVCSASWSLPAALLSALYSLLLCIACSASCFLPAFCSFALLALLPAAPLLCIACSAFCSLPNALLSALCSLPDLLLSAQEAGSVQEGPWGLFCPSSFMCLGIFCGQVFAGSLDSFLGQRTLSGALFSMPPWHCCKSVPFTAFPVSFVCPQESIAIFTVASFLRKAYSFT